MAEQKLKGKVVFVGGGAKNLGGLISRTLANQGAKIIVHYNSASTKDAANETVAAVKAAGSDGLAIDGDFMKGAVVERVFAEGKSVSEESTSPSILLARS